MGDRGIGVIRSLVLGREADAPASSLYREELLSFSRRRRRKRLNGVPISQDSSKRSLRVTNRGDSSQRLGLKELPLLE
jgi:hypothetical protein